MPVSITRDNLLSEIVLLLNVSFRIGDSNRIAFLEEKIQGQSANISQAHFRVVVTENSIPPCISAFLALNSNDKLTIHDREAQEIRIAYVTLRSNLSLIADPAAIYNSLANLITSIKNPAAEVALAAEKHKVSVLEDTLDKVAQRADAEKNYRIAVVTELQAQRSEIEARLHAAEARALELSSTIRELQTTNLELVQRLKDSQVDDDKPLLNSFFKK